MHVFVLTIKNCNFKLTLVKIKAIKQARRLEDLGIYSKIAYPRPVSEENAFLIQRK